MKNKAPLSLIEQLCMLLVFALAACLCLRVYVLSGQISRSSETRSEAVTAVQNTAEAVKFCRGDMSKCTALFGGSAEGGCWRIGFDEKWEEMPMEDACYYISVLTEDTGLPTLGKATVIASKEDGEEIFSVVVSWQEVGHE